MALDYAYYHLVFHLNSARMNISELASFEILLKDTSNEQEIRKLCDEIEELCKKIYPLLKTNKNNED